MFLTFWIMNNQTIQNFTSGPYWSTVQHAQANYLVHARGELPILMGVKKRYTESSCDNNDEFYL